MPVKPLALGILISGQGSNLQAIIDAIHQSKLNAKINVVISNKADAYGLARAKAAAIPTEILLAENFASRHDFDQELLHILSKYKIDLVVLAGFMRILTPEFVRIFYGKILNIHPSLLPKYPGLRTHRRVLEAKEPEHGVSIHFVTADLDSGPIIAQAKLAVFSHDTEATLKQRIHSLEHRLYPLVIQWIAEGKIYLKDDQVYLNNKKLTVQDCVIDLENI